jgi:uncharacterized membrane protein/mono/diheme cytochrome c family protein
MRTFPNFLSLIIVSACLLSGSAVAAQSDTPVDFARDIKPILENHCIACHGPTEEEDFRIDVKDEALNYVIPEDADSSDLYLYLVSDDENEKMPPDDAHNPLTPKQILLVKNWINDGAEWPDDAGEFQDIPLPAAGQDEAAANADQQQVLNAVGSLHVAVIHLPIGLLLAAGLFAFFSLRGNFVMSDCAYYCLWLGTLGAILACATGWFYAPMERYGVQALDATLLDQEDSLFWHRTSGIIATVIALLLSLFAASARNRDPDDGLMWKLGLILLAFGIGFVGHTGGELTHGEDHYKDLNGLYQSFFEQEGEGAVEEAEPISVPENDMRDEEAESGIGTTSDPSN